MQARAEVVAIGKKICLASSVNRIGARVVAQATALGDQPHIEALIGPVRCCSTPTPLANSRPFTSATAKFINTMKQR